MALNKEIWIDTIVGNLFGPATAVGKSIDHSEYISNKTVHVPNAGAPAKVGKNVKKLPLEVSAREDMDLTYDIDDYKLYPTVITNAEEVELSYNKRNSVVAEGRSRLYEEVSMDVIAKWVSGVTPKAKDSLTVKDMLLNASKQFAADKVPRKDRYAMLSVDNYYKLLEELSAQEQFAFSAAADASKGVLGVLYGFEIVEEYLLPAKVEMLAWHRTALSHALGSLKIYESEDDPTYYGDILSGEIRAGGSVIRSDAKGVYVIDDDGVKDAAPVETTEDLEY